MTAAAEYEKVYSDAREVLFLRGKRLGKPAYTNNGLRYCPVDGFSFTDRDVLKEAWGEDLADEILHDLPEAIQVGHSCPDCERLWQDYADATARYLGVFSKLHNAEAQQDFAALVELRPLQAQTAASRFNARKAVMDHGSVHFPA